MVSVQIGKSKTLKALELGMGGGSGRLAVGVTDMPSV